MQNQISKIVAFPEDINLHYDKLGGGGEGNCLLHKNALFSS